MYFNKTLLQRFHISEDVIEEILKGAPAEGIPVIDLFKDPQVPDEFKFWCKRDLDLDAEDIAAFNEVMHIENSTNIYNSKYVNDSQIVLDSSDISDSNNIVDSQEVEESYQIYHTYDCSCSHEVYHSSLITNSNHIYESVNITNGRNITMGTNCDTASDLRNCSNIVKCKMLTNCQDLISSFLCSNCCSLNNAILCYGISNKDNVIFNKEVPEEMFQMIMTRLKKMLKLVHLHFFSKEPQLKYGLYTKGVTNQYDLYYSELPDIFWNWIKTLPGYDSFLLYKITMNAKVLTPPQD